MQRTYISTLMELAEKDERILHVIADSGTGYDALFQRNFPGRMLNFGIAEQNMIGAAAGMATAGKIPFVYAQGAFLSYRAFEFIRDDVCFQNLNVKIIGIECGLSLGSLGPTHHTTEDLAVLRPLPNLMILSPSTPKQVSECVKRAYEHNGAVYIKIGMNNEKEFFADDYTLPQNGLDVLNGGNSDYVLFTTGSILEEADEAVRLLADGGIKITLVNVSVIKPFVADDALSLAKNARAVFAVEEHSVTGGLGSMLCEAVAERGLPVPVKRIGLNDMFALGYGTQKSVRAQNGLDAQSIAQKIARCVKELGR